MINLALYHPQIPQNTGTLLRMASCLGIHVDLIRPFGFIFSDKKLRRAGMDYLLTSDYEIHDSFEEFFKKYREGRRFVAMDVGAKTIPHCEFNYQPNDILIVGSEHYGFLPENLAQIDCRVKIPMLADRRSMNMAVSAAIVVGEALSQLKLFPKCSNAIT